jgi:hypothetical protein
MKRILLSLSFLLVLASGCKAEVIVPCGQDEYECRAFTGDPAFFIVDPEPGGPIDAYPLGRVLLGLTAHEFERSLRCLAIAAYGEGRDQGTQGMQAVSWSILNRLSSAMGADPCEILAKKGSYEFLSKPQWRVTRKAILDGRLPAWPAPKAIHDQRALTQARLIAWRIGTGEVDEADDVTDGATHFFASRLQRKLGRPVPRWTRVFEKTVNVGGHVFYR